MSYVSQKQLGGVITFSDVTASGQVGVATDLGQARSLIFRQTTASISITLIAPTPSDDRLFTIVNRGTVAVTINGVVIEPGPAYGLYWNGTSYIPQAVEGVGTVGNLESSESIELSGDGSVLTPLTANLKVSTALHNLLTFQADGLYAPFTDIGTGSTLFVDTVNGSDTNTGSQRQPLKTISAAMALAINFTTIFVFPGSYHENVTYAKNGVSILGFGSMDSQAVQLNGIVSCPAVSRPRMKDINLKAPSGAPQALVFGGCLGAHSFENVSISHTDGNTNTVVSFNGDNSSYYIFKDCSIDGKISVESTTQTSQLGIYISGGNNAPKIVQSAANSSVFIRDMMQAGPVTHTAGTFGAKNIFSLLKDTSGNSINSTANAGLLALMDVSFIQADGSFGALVKSGNCPYAFGSLFLAENNDVFTGPRVVGDNANQVGANFPSPSSYSPTDQTVTGHLRGIDAKLASTAGGLSAVTSSDSSSVDFSGAGTGVNPLTAAVKVSSDPNNVLQTNADGLFVSASNTGLDSVAHNNSNNISMTGTGTVTDPLSADVFLSQTPHNLLTREDDGLYAGEIARTIEIAFQIDYGWLAQQTLIAYSVVSPFTLPAGLVGFTYGMSATPSITSVIAIFKNSTQIGELFINNNVIGVTFAADVSFSSGDVLTAVVDRDAQFNYVAFTFLGSRPYLNS